jgi:fructokinase
MRRVYTVGETVLDIIFKNHVPVAAKAGGSMLNATVSLGRLGIAVSFISEYAVDEVGSFIDSFLVSNHVDTSYVCRYSDGKSALALAFLDENNNAGYSFYKNYPSKRLGINVPDFNEDDIVVFGSFYGMAPELRVQILSIITKAKQQKAIVYYDPNFRKSHEHEMDRLRPNILENITLSDMVRGSDEDFEFIFGAKNSTEAFQHIKPSCNHLIVTANQKGVFVHSNEFVCNYPVPQIEPVSTVGAGDNFNAGMIYSIIKEEIKLKDLHQLPAEKWAAMIKTATEFATNVCMSYDNYISEEFAKGLVDK